MLLTSMGGARPKAVVEDNEGLWAANFNRPDNRWSNPRVERAMLELAKAAASVLRPAVSKRSATRMFFSSNALIAKRPARDTRYPE